MNENPTDQKTVHPEQIKAASEPVVSEPTVSEPVEDTAKLNDRSLRQMIRTLEFSKGHFSLILAHCNYAGLRRQIVRDFRQLSDTAIREIELPDSVTTLYSFIQSELKGEIIEAMSVSGLEAVKSVDRVLAATNLVREEFRKNFPFPVILWMDDHVLNRFVRVAPDFRSWSGSPVRFEPDDQALLHALRQNTERLFDEILASRNSIAESNSVADMLNPREFESFLREIRLRRLNLSPEAHAHFRFLQGINLRNGDQRELAIACYEESLDFFRQEGKSEQQGVLFSYLARCHEQNGDLEKAKFCFEKCIRAFEKQKELLARFTFELCKVLEKSEQWDQLKTLAKRSLSLNRLFPDSNRQRCPLLHKFLAEVAMQGAEWKKAARFAEKALTASSPGTPKNIRDSARLILARAFRYLGHSEKAADILEEALAQGEFESDPRLYIWIAELLHTLCAEQGEYLRAFRTKQEKHSLEQQFGFRAFIGAGRLKAGRNINRKETDIADEIQASGRQADVTRLVHRIGRTDYKLIVIHGPSGVGKSSILEAGLNPELKKKGIGIKDVLTVLTRSYSLNWAEKFGRHFQDALASEGHQTDLPLNSAGLILGELWRNDDRNFLTVLIFDQFEEFFFANSEPHTRGKFFSFLNECLNIPFVKVILSLREDYLHYLLECDRFANLEVIGNDILARKIRYPLGNFRPEDAKSVIRSLTERTSFHMEEHLIDRIVHDLAETSGEVSPIELQIVGSQLQTEGITTLEKYKPREKLVQGFLEEVIRDCGRENENIARVILYLLTDENNTRPLKTRSELAGELRKLKNSGLMEGPEQLELILNILVGTGLVFLVPEQPADRYQLVHDYLVTFIRKGQGGELLTQLRAEKEKRRIAEASLSYVLRRQLKVAIVSGSLILILAFMTIFVFAQKADTEKKNAMQIEAQRQLVEKQRQRAEEEGRRAEKQAGKAREQRQIAEEQRRIAEEQTRIARGNLRKAEISETEALRQSSQIRFFSNDDLGALLAGMKAGKKSSQPGIPAALKKQTVFSLREIVYGIREKNRLEGHESPVVSLGFSPDGKFIASGSSDRTVSIWSARDGSHIMTLRGHMGTVFSLNFSPDGKIIASGSYDRTVKLWDAGDGTEIRTLKGHTGGVQSVAFSPDGKMLVSGSDDRTVRLWDMSDGHQIRMLNGHSGRVFALAFSPNGKLIASGSYDQSIRIWSVRHKRAIRVLKGHVGSVRSLAFSRDGKMLASASDDRTMRLWNVKDGTRLMVMKEISGRLLSVCLSPDGKTVVSGSDERVIRLWDVRDGKEIRTLRGHAGSVRSLAFSPDGKTLASGSDDRGIRIWNMEDSREIRTLKRYSGPVFSVKFSPDRKILATGVYDNTIRLLDVERGREIGRLEGHAGSVLSISFSPDGKMLASGSDDHSVKLWDTEQNLEIRTLKWHAGSVRSVAFSPDGKTLVSGSYDRTVKLWDVARGHQLRVFRGHSENVRSVEFSPDGRMIVSGSDDGTVRLWDVGDGHVIKVFKGHSNSVFSVVFSPDGKILASGSFDSTVRLWNIENAREITTLRGHSGSVRNLDFSPDGKILASGSDDGTILLWDVGNGSEINILKGHSNSVFSVNFSPDGKTLASGSNDRSVKLWNLGKLRLGLDDLLIRGCRWMYGYLRNNPNVSAEDRNMCNEILGNGKM